MRRLPFSFLCVFPGTAPPVAAGPPVPPAGRECLVVCPFQPAACEEPEPRLTEICSTVQQWMQSWKDSGELDYAIWDEEALEISKSGGVVRGMGPSTFRRARQNHNTGAYERRRCDVTQWTLDGAVWKRNDFGVSGFADFACSTDRFVVVRARQGERALARIVDTTDAAPDIVPGVTVHDVQLHSSMHWVGHQDGCVVGGRISLEPPALTVEYTIEVPNRWPGPIDLPWHATWVLDGRYVALGGGMWIEPASGRHWMPDPAQRPAFRASATGDLVVLGAHPNYRLARVKDDGTVEPIDSRHWTVGAGDALWWISPTGNYVGGRNNDSALPLPGAVGWEVVREIQLGPKRTPDLALNHEAIRGWLRLP